MKKYDGLLMKASRKYSIAQGKREDDLSYKARIIYTIVGRMALASVCDSPETESVSIIHVKKRICELLTCYLDMYPELKSLFSDDYDSFSGEICNTYMNAGCFYHEPYRIVLSKEAEGGINGVVFTRGFSFDYPQCISGLGTYYEGESESNDIKSMFLPEREPLVMFWGNCVKSINWSTMQLGDRVEYLKMGLPFKGSYWTNKEDKSGRVSILRQGGDSESLIYYFYRYENGSCKVSQIPTWMVSNGYRGLSNACLKINNALPKTEFFINGEVVNIHFNYLPPTEELNMWKLYSWPASMSNISGNFKRQCSIKAFEAIKNTLIPLGYEFEEVDNE